MPAGNADARKCRAAVLAKLAAFFQACVASRALHRRPSNGSGELSISRGPTGGGWANRCIQPLVVLAIFREAKQGSGEGVDGRSLEERSLPPSRLSRKN